MLNLVEVIVEKTVARTLVDGDPVGLLQALDVRRGHEADDVHVPRSYPLR